MKTGALIAILLALVGSARAQSAWTAPAAPGVGFDQRIGERLPLDAAGRDDHGAQARLADYFGHAPVVLVFGYSRCPQLCSVVASGAVEALRDVSASAGRDYELVYLSIDPTDAPRELAALKRRDVGRYGRNGAERGWHYLASDQATIQRVTAAAGFRFTFDSRSRLYAHASGFLVATPDGRIARYFPGVDFQPKKIAEAIQRAADGTMGEPTFNLLLVCARGLGVTGRHGALIWGTLAVAVVATIFIVLGGIGWMLRKERRDNARTEAAR